MPWKRLMPKDSVCMPKPRRRRPARGAMVSMPLAGKLIERWGSRRVASPAAVGFATALLLLAFAPSYATLILAAVVFGVWKGALDVSMSRLTRRPSLWKRQWGALLTAAFRVSGAWAVS